MAWHQFYEKFISLFFGLAILLFIFLVAAELLFFYFSSKSLILCYGYCIVVSAGVIYAVKYFVQFRDFRENLYLLIPSNDYNRSSSAPLQMEALEEVPLKVCLCYRNGAGYEEIKQVLGMSHPMQVKRELIKGLDILLRSYEKHERKVKAT